MTMQSIGGGVLIPAVTPGLLTTPTFQVGLTLNDSDDKVAYVFRVPKSGNIRYVGFRTGTVTTGDTLKVGIQTTDATTGSPTGSAYGGMVAGTQVLVNTDDNLWFTVQLGTDATATAGDFVAAVIEFNSFVAGNLQIISHLSQTGGMVFPYYDLYEASWNPGNSGLPVFYIKYSDGTVSYIANAMPFSGIAAQTFNNAGTNEYALRFRLPVPVRMAGVYLAATWAGDTKIILYDSDGTSILNSITWDKDYIQSVNPNHFFMRYASPVTLVKNTFYRLGLQPQSASLTTIILATVPEAVALDQMEGGQDFHLSTKNAGTWTDVTTQRPMFSILLDQFDDGTAVGGLLTHPGMAGGMRA